LQEIITLNSKKFLVVGIGLNIVSNPVINDKYKATNILAETNKKYKIKEILELIINTYEKFFAELNSFNYDSFKKKSDLMALKSIT